MLNADEIKILVAKAQNGDEEAKNLMLPRSSWDDCVEFVTETFDLAATYLPPTITNPAELDREGHPLMPREYDPEKWKTAMDATGEAIELAEESGYRLYEDANASGKPDEERGKQNYYQCFIEETWSGQPEYLFAIGAQNNLDVNIQRLAAARVWDASTDSYSADGFRQYLVPTLQIAEVFLTDKGLPLWADPATKDKSLSELLKASDGYTIFRIAADDCYRLIIDGKEVFADWKGHALSSKSHIMKVRAGQTYEVRIEYREKTGNAFLDFTCLKVDAKSLSKLDADNIVVSVGFDKDTEDEGSDRTFRLPPG